jgi:copper resistance protein C
MSFPIRRVLTSGAAAAALALGLLAGSAPAQAHDALASTSPAAGETVTTNPGKVSITLTNAPDTGLPGSNIITVTAPDGHVVSEGDIAVDGATLSINAAIDHDGEHTVEWRAVSADGHPIDGTFTFTYAGVGSHGAEETSTAAATTEPTATSAAPSPAPATESPAAASATSGQDNTGLFIGIGAVLLLLVAAGAYFIGRRAKGGTGASQ